MGINTEKGFKEYRYFHCKHLLPLTPALTFKFDVNQENSTMKFSWASCSDNDNFDRGVGKKFVDERIKTDGTVLVCSYDRSMPLIENAINGMHEVHNLYLMDSDYKTSVDENSESKKLITEVIRALNIYDEVSIWVGREAVLDRVVCEQGC